MKALFLVLLGLCHLDHLQAVKVDPEALADRVLAMVDVLVPPQD